MSYIVLALSVVCMALMFLLGRSYKVALLFVSLMLFSLVTIPIGNIRANSLISLCFLLSELKYIRYYWRRISHSVLIWFSGLALLTFAISIVTSPHLHDPFSVVAFAQTEILVKLFSMLYAFVSLRKTASLKPTLQFTFYAMLAMTLIAFLNYVTKSSIMVNAFADDITEGYDFITSKRFRVQATFINPFDYGFMCVLVSLLHLYGFKSGLEQLPYFVAVEICGLFGVFACGCRTVVLCYVLCVVVFLIASRKKKKDKLIILLCIAAVGFLALAFVPSARNAAVYMTSVFDPDSGVEGSSIDGRAVQLAAVLSHIQGDFVFGRGVNYFYYDLGWSEGYGHSVDSELYGLEGIYLNLLLERGVVGLLIYLAMMIMLLVFIIRNRRYGHNLYALGLSVFTLYVVFCFMTGELASTPPTYLVLGYVISVIYTRRSIVKKRLAYARK